MAMAQVESANTVGFTTRSAAADEYIMIGTQFEDVSSTVSTAVDANINDLVSGTYVAVPYGDGVSFQNTAPIIKAWVYDQTISAWTYESYYYISGAWDDANKQEVTGWADYAGDLAESTLANGAAVWFKSANACTITFCGAVAQASVSLDADNGEYVLISNPMPVEFNLNSADITWAGISSVPYGDGVSFQNTAPIIKAWVYDQTISAWTYESYYYISGAWDDANKQEVTGWADYAGDLAENTIPVGYGFWFKPTSNVTITFASPIAANN